MNELHGTLQNDLKKFGLNPSEWTIKELEKEIYQIAHVEDQEFYFLGKAQQVGPVPEWTQLKLMSC